MRISNTLSETRQMAAEIADKVKNGGIVYLYGDLGSGKTTFTKGIAERLKIDQFAIKSPTYIYIRQYYSFIHIDLYRLNEIDDLLWEEIKELMENRKNIIIIEWADKLQGRKTPDGIKIHLSYISENSRQIDVKE